ncbi:MAG: patatin-like phospholipase family protein [Candidatus Shapirobacteria bacterium]|nr:patatin-like phospholipase family protein [Candidatus Shapirobacteria bacterium]
MFNKNKIGLVLGGGGARGFFHMGVIKGLQEMGIKINEISGTSIGAIVGLMYAANPKIDFEKEASELNFSKLIQSIIFDKTLRPAGTSLDREAILEKFLKNYIKADHFDDLKIKMRFNATDINNNEEIIFEKGKIFPGVMASISIPGVFPPLKYHDKFLVDGGVVNNVPTSLIEKSGKIIISDITKPIKKINEKSTVVDVLHATIIAMQQSNSLERAKHLKNKKIIYLNSIENKAFVLDFRKKNYQYLIDLGYKMIMERKEQL